MGYKNFEGVKKSPAGAGHMITEKWKVILKVILDIFEVRS